jgi:O-antigen/teichoic acid export membrane protein
MFPEVTALHARKDHVALRRLFVDSSRYLALVAVILAAACFVWCPDVFRVWLRGSTTETVVRQASLLCRILTVSFLGVFLGGMGGQLLSSTLRIKAFTLVCFGQSLSALILDIMLVRQYGIVGVAVGTTLCAVAFRAVLMPLLGGRVVAVSYLRYVRSSLLRPLATGIILLAGLSVARWLLSPLGLGKLAVAGAVTFLLSAAASWCLGLSAGERAYLRRKIQGRLGGKTHKLGLPGAVIR